MRGSGILYRAMDARSNNRDVASNLITTAEFMRVLARDLDAMWVDELPEDARARAALRARIRDLLHHLDADRQALSDILTAALE